MNRSVMMLGLSFLVAQPVLALTSFRSVPVESILVRTGAADCKGPIATANRPIRATSSDPDRLVRMKQAGKLPDQFVCGKCTYSLSGDPGAAYYVKTCK